MSNPIFEMGLAFSFTSFENFKIESWQWKFTRSNMFAFMLLHRCVLFVNVSVDLQHSPINLLNQSLTIFCELTVCIDY